MKKKRLIPSSFIITELARAGLHGKSTGDHIMISCPFHRDNTPSMGISLGGRVPAGVYHCFSCRAKGTWNDFADRLGLRKWDTDSVSDVVFINKQKKQVKEDVELDEVLALSEWDGKWKSYSIDFLNRFGARKMWDDKYNEYFLYFPRTYMWDEYGYIRVKIHNTERLETCPKYWFTSGMAKPLYPVDYLLKADTTVVTLVEGVGDVFRCLQHGIPALAMCGVGLTDFMFEQLETLSVQTVVLCTDGDEAGQRALTGYISEAGNHVEGLLAKLENKGYDIRVLVPPKPTQKELDRGIKKHDPDSMPIEYIRALQHLVVSNGGSLLD